MASNPRRFCAASLLEYGAGRELSVGDKRVLEKIVKAEPPEGYHFRDLIRLTVQSEVGNVI